MGTCTSIFQYTNWFSCRYIFSDEIRYSNLLNSTFLRVIFINKGIFLARKFALSILQVDKKKFH